MRSVILLLICAMVPISVAEAGAIAHMFEAVATTWCRGGRPLKTWLRDMPGAIIFLLLALGTVSTFYWMRIRCSELRVLECGVHYFLDDTNRA